MKAVSATHDRASTEPTVAARPALWRWPIVLGAVTATGLLAALLGDGLWDALSWLTLATPLAVAAWCVWRRPRGRR